MNQYINDINIAKDDFDNEIVMQFNQKQPAFNEKGEIIGVTIETLGSFVLYKPVAEQFLNNLKELLDGTEETLEFCSTPVESIPTEKTSSGE